MKITIDTNPLVRLIVRDDPAQHRAAEQVLRAATSVVVTLPCLCELAWVLRSVYRFSRAEIASALETLMTMRSITLDRPAAKAGLDALRAGGDFADGVIAFEGRQAGGDVFISFDKRAVALVRGQGFKAELLRL